MTVKVELVGLRLIPGFAMASPSPAFPPGPHPGRQMIISPRPSDLKQSESGVGLPTIFRRCSGNVVKAMP